MGTKLRFIFMLAFFLLIVASAISQNRLNRNGQRTGKWIVYSDKEKTKKSFEGRFRNGNAVGKAYYYNMDGVLDRKEVSRFKRLHTTIYYPDGKVKHVGKARIVNEEKKIRYFFYGRWKYYKPTGELEKYCYFENGQVIKTEYLDKSIKTNDSLVFALNEIDKRFNELNKDLLDSIAHSRFNAVRRERLQSELYMRDTTSFKAIEKIIQVFGYPSKEKAADAVAIPFYVLSFAPASIKQDYLPILKGAAGRGDLSWTSLAFFIDKMQLELGKKQIYGTQSYLKKMEWVNYPVEDPEGLAARRKEVGLEND